MSERLLPVGTPIILKTPLTGDVGWRNLGEQSFSMGRVEEVDGDHYGVIFEGLLNDEGKQILVPCKRDDFVLARSGT